MAAKVEKLEGNKAKLHIEISAEKFEEGIKKAFQKMKGRFNIPGFRKGKAPRAIVENHYGSEIFYEDAFEEVFPESYQEAVKEHELDVVSRPDIDILSINKQDGVTYVAEVTLRPEVTLGKYEGIKLKKEIRKITAKEVDAEIEKTREQNARWVDVERAAKDGDTVDIDFDGTINGEAFHGGHANGQTLVLGSKTFIPGFEEGIAGMKPGDEKDLDVTFPKDYSPEFAEKDAVFHVKLNGVKEKELPELDDEFAQDVSEFETLAEYKKDVKKNLQERADKDAQGALENQLVEEISKNAKVDIPEVMIEGEIDYQIQQLSYQLMYQGMKLEDYLNYAGITLEKMREDFKPVSEQQVRTMLVVQALIEKLKIEPTEKEIEQRIEKMAKENGDTVEKYKKAMGEDAEARVKNTLTMEKLFDILLEKAVIEEVEPKKKTAKKAEPKAEGAKADEKPAAKKAPAKKPAAKKEDAKAAEKKPAAKKPAAKKAPAKKEAEKKDK
ncbi:MAG: trigger factor [Christensenellaceae bacterium]